MPKFSKGQWIAISGVIAVVVVGVATIYFQSGASSQRVVDSPGSINTVGQSGGINIVNSDETLKKQAEYMDVAALNFNGKSFECQYPISCETDISKILSPYLQTNADNSLKSDCSAAAMAAFKAVITLNPRFPFSYYFLGACEKIAGVTGWQIPMKTAKDIFDITVTIAGHNPNHDVALSDIHSRFGL